jgi:D-inositol-3-phosphate glycosyltransferase
LEALPPGGAFLCAMQQALTILCSSPGWGGLEMNTVKLAKALAARSWNVSVLAVEKTTFYEHSATAGLHVGCIEKPAALTAVPRARRIARWMRQQNSGLLLMPFRRDIATASLAKRLFAHDLKLVYQQHMKLGVSKRDPIHTVRYAALDAWIAPLNYLKVEAQKKSRVPAKKIHVIPFGIDVDYFAQNPFSKEEARAILHLPEAVPMLGVLGRIDPKKGQDFLIEALPVLDEKLGIAYHLLIAGSSTLGEGENYEKSLHQKVQALGLNGRVHFRKGAEDVRPFYRAIDVFCMPSEGETYGMVTLEALASGLPVVGTDRDGTREILGASSCGYLYEPNDATGFTKRLGQLQREHVVSEPLQARYGFDEMVSATEAVLKYLQP